MLLGENSLKLPRISELHIGIFIQQQQQACQAHPHPGRLERGTSPLSERERARAHSQTAADEREANLNTSHKVYIERSLAFSGAKTICQHGYPRGGFLTSEARMEVLQGRKKHSSTLLITSGLNMLLYICRLSGTYIKLHTSRNTEKPCSCLHNYMI